MTEQPAVLILDDGSIFPGYACGAQKEARGEVIFTTAMTGYQETITDPSYHGQIVAFTSAHIGNYGACGLDDEGGRISAAGAVFHDLFQLRQSRTRADGRFPHWRAGESLDERLQRDGVSGIYGVDTRALTLRLRQGGVRNGVISSSGAGLRSLLSEAEAVPSMAGRDMVKEITTPAVYEYSPAERPGEVEIKSGRNRVYKVAVYDFGVKKSILDSLLAAGLAPTVWPADTPAEAVLSSKPDGILLSNGPGDPAACSYAVASVRGLLGRKPIFGICLGHQILGLALGGRTFKMAFGHHGANQPVNDLESGRVWITSQNHGFCLDPASLPNSAPASHWNLNDGSLEGLRCRDIPAFSVQFHPEAGPGPSDAAELFWRFRQLIKNQDNKHA